MVTPPSILSLRRRATGKRGQALVELVAVLFILVVIAFGLIDFSWFLYHELILANVTREAANLSSRGRNPLAVSNMTEAITAVITSAQPLNISANGRVIMTSVTGTPARVTGQVSQGGLAVASRIGVSGGAATLPATATPVPPALQTLYVAEVFYTYRPITPIGRLLRITLPPRIYDAAYFVGQ
jgi:Flp pilus assembly protein TadG